MKYIEKVERLYASKLFTVTELAEIFHYSEQTIWALVKNKVPRRNSRKVLTPATIQLIKQLRKYLTAKELAIRFQCTERTIHKALKK